MKSLIGSLSALARQIPRRRATVRATCARVLTGRLGWVALIALLLASACRSVSGSRAAPPIEPVAATPTPTPAPIQLPADDAPHDVLTEWWYYTGHLRTADGERYGFEFVVFQSTRRDHPVGYLAHFAITDPQRKRFRFAARTAQRPTIPATLDLVVDGWTLQGGDGRDRLAATMNDYAVELSLVSQKPAVLHRGGLISFGPAGDSYYYSRTRLAVTGSIRVGGTWHVVEGLAWFDHQWGNYIVPTVGGWDWFSIQLGNGAELMVSLLRDASGTRSGTFATFVDTAGRAFDVPASAIDIVALDRWHSPHTGATYPAGWRLQIADQPELGVPAIALQLSPVLPDQELAFNPVSYWEGAVTVVGTLAGQAVTGEGYVELTGYAADR